MQLASEIVNGHCTINSPQVQWSWAIVDNKIYVAYVIKLTTILIKVSDKRMSNPFCVIMNNIILTSSNNIVFSFLQFE